MHGLQGNSATTSQLATWIRDAYPGTKTFQIPLFEDDASLNSLSQQVTGLAAYIRDTVQRDPDSFKNGYDLVGFSQGGLLFRTLVQYMDDHNVHTLISLAAPQMGVYGQQIRTLANQQIQSSGLGPIISAITGKPADLDALAYEPLLQESVGAANMWNDPTRQSEYLQRNLFLPVYNGRTSDTIGNQKRKSNFLRLKKVAFMVGSFGSDGTLEPWQSGVFGFFKAGSTSEIMPMEAIEEYKADSFGLKTLDQHGKLTIKTPARVMHAAWLSDFNVVSQHVLPQLECSLEPDSVPAVAAVTDPTTTAAEGSSVSMKDSSSEDPTTAGTTIAMTTVTTTGNAAKEMNTANVVPLSGSIRLNLWRGVNLLFVVALW